MENKMLDIEQLIFLVHKRKELFDSSHPKHHDRDVVASAWRDVADQLNISDDVAKAKWRNLRSNYMRERRNVRKRQCDSDPGVAPLTKWPFYPMLQFLDNYAKDVQEKEAQDDVTSNGDDSQLSDVVIVHIDEQPAGSCIMQPNCSSKYDARNKQRNNELEHMNKTTAKMEEEDMDRLFLLSLLPLVKQLSPMKKLDFKSEVFAMLKEKLYPQASSSCNRNCKCHN